MNSLTQFDHVIGHRRTYARILIASRVIVSSLTRSGWSELAWR